MLSLNDDAIQGTRDFLLREKCLNGFPGAYKLQLQHYTNLNKSGLHLHGQPVNAAKTNRQKVSTTVDLPERKVIMQPEPRSTIINLECTFSAHNRHVLQRRQT